jgi:hypothetical protein
MEGWLYGLFTLLGVLAGGLFTYLGMKKQLKQQKELDSRHWKRKVRGSPLLRLRSEVATMATEQHKLVAFVYRYRQHERIGISEEEAKKKLLEASDDCNNYLESGNFARALFTQFDTELKNKAEEILKNSQKALVNAMNYTSQEALKESLDLIEGNADKITEVQELISKKLEEL